MRTTASPALTLESHRWLRYFTLCVLYFAQGVPWGFVSIALVSILSEQGATVAQTGALTALAALPWTFKVLWAPLIDCYSLPVFGRRRPWIVLAQLCMAGTLLIGFSTTDLSSELTLSALGVIVFAHNCFASLQDVATDALAIDILQPEESGKANGMMWGSKLVGISLGGAGMAALTINLGMEVALQLLASLMVLIMLVPLFVQERAGNRRFPWSPKHGSLQATAPTRPKFLEVFRELIVAFRKRATFLGIFAALFSGVGLSLCVPLNAEVLVQRVGWSAESYSYANATYGLAGKVIGALAGGWLCSRMGNLRIWSFGIVTVSCLLATFALTSQYWTHATYPINGFIFVFQGAAALAGVAALTTFMKLSWTKAAATQFTLYMTMSNIGGTAGATLTMIGLSHEGLYLLAAGVSLAPLCFLPFLVASDIKTRREEYSPGERVLEETLVVSEVAVSGS